VYRRILGPAYDIEKGNCRILTNKELYEIVKKIHSNRVRDYGDLGMYIE
jgi:hypothetical protein